MGEESIFEGDVGIWDADVIVRPAPGVPEQSSHGLAVQKLVGGSGSSSTSRTKPRASRVTVSCAGARPPNTSTAICASTASSGTSPRASTSS
jgi:hypothetical protein